MTDRQESNGSSGNDLLLRQDRGGISRLTLNRPQQRNALSLTLLERLKEELDLIAGESSIRVVVIRGAGPAFSAGHDLKELRANPSIDFYQRVFGTFAAVMLAIARLPQPVVAQVHGLAFAAGCQLVAASDLAIATAEARFSTPGINVGLFCSTPMVPLIRSVPRKAAMEMLLIGDSIDAPTALGLGLLNRVVPASDLELTVEAMARQLATKSRAVVALGKKAVAAQSGLDLAAAYAAATEAMVANMQLGDAAEGIDAFLGKRTPHFQDH